MGRILRGAVFILFFIIQRVSFAQDDLFKSLLPRPEKPPEKIEPFKMIKRETVDYRPIKNLNVEGIFWGIEAPLAIINGRTYKEGDFLEEIRGAKIIKIDKKGVEISYGDRSFILKPRLKLRDKIRVEGGKDER